MYTCSCCLKVGKNSAKPERKKTMNPSSIVKQEKLKQAKEAQERKKLGDAAPKKMKQRQPKVAFSNPYENKWKVMAEQDSKICISNLSMYNKNYCFNRIRLVIPMLERVPKKPELFKHFGAIVGVNAVSKMMEKFIATKDVVHSQLHLILIADSACKQSPPIMTEHLRVMAAMNKIPLAPLTCTAEELGKCFGIPTLLAVGFVQNTANSTWLQGVLKNAKVWSMHQELAWQKTLLAIPEYQPLCATHQTAINLYTKAVPATKAIVETKVLQTPEKQQLQPTPDKKQQPKQEAQPKQQQQQPKKQKKTSTELPPRVLASPANDNVKKRKLEHKAAVQANKKPRKN